MTLNDPELHKRGFLVNFRNFWMQRTFLTMEVKIIIYSSVLSDEQHPAPACYLVRCQLRNAKARNMSNCKVRNKMRISHCIIAYILRTYIRRNRKCKWFQDITFLIRPLYTRLRTAVFASSLSYFTLGQISRWRISRFALYARPVSLQRPISPLTDLN